MALVHSTLRRVAPSILSSASGIQIRVRIRRWGRFSARILSLRHFLGKYSQFILGLSRCPAKMWRHAKSYRQRLTFSSPIASAAEETLLPQTGHQLRQVFTALRIGLDLIKRKEAAGKINEIPELVKRLQDVVAEGIQNLNVLDPPYALSRQK